MDNNKRELYKAYNDVFNTPSGKLVLDDLNNLITNAKNEKDMQEMFRKQWYNNGIKSVINIINGKKDYLNKV